MLMVGVFFWRVARLFFGEEFFGAKFDGVVVIIDRMGGTSDFDGREIMSDGKGELGG